MNKSAYVFINNTKPLALNLRDQTAVKLHRRYKKAKCQSVLETY